MIGLISLILSCIVVCVVIGKHFYKKEQYQKSQICFYFALVVCIICLSIMLILYLSGIIFSNYEALKENEKDYGITFTDCINLVTQVVTFLGTAGLTLGTFMYTNSKKLKKETHHRRASMRPQPLCRKKHI